MAVKRFTDEEINKANNISIVDYINKLNLEIKRTGKTLKVEGYGGLHIDPINNRWNCFSEKKGGGIVQLAMYLENKTWVEAIKTLLGNSYESNKINNRVYNKSKENKDFHLPKKNNTYNHVIAYLIKSRGIDKDIVYQMISSKKIYEDERKNCVFVGYDKDNNSKYAGLRGTNTSIPFKGEVQGSNKGYSFNITNTEDRTLYVFESPIELMSYMTLYKKYCGEDFNFNGLSLAGTSDISLEQFLKDNDISTINLCLDNDEVGKKAMVEIREKYKDDYDIQIKLPKLKDWNEDLVYSPDTLKKTDELRKLEIAKSLIMSFISEEYDEELRPFDYEDIEHIGIAHTTTEDGEYDIDIKVDLINHKINKYANGELLHTDKYENMDSLIEELKYLSFDDLVHHDIQDKIYEKQDEWDMEL